MTTDKTRYGGWKVGQRVTREDSQKLGTIVYAESSTGKIKVKWDDGSTSYYARDKASNVKLKPTD